MSDDYNAVGAWFLGPKGENHKLLQELFTQILNIHVQDARINYFPEDPSPIPPEMQATDIFEENVEKLKYLVAELVPQLSSTCVPAWNPRYVARMNMDTSLPSIVGYFAGMLINPNNLTLENSPLSTVIEIKVGLQLCNMVGFSTEVGRVPRGWGHITSGGTVANLESMWAARNLKFYPLTVRMAMKKELIFIADTFKMFTCDGVKKLLQSFTQWELLNIYPDDVLDIPTRLENEYGITAEALWEALKPYRIQEIGKDQIEKEFNIQKPMIYYASAAAHYSFEKSAAITGIGASNVLSVDVDDYVRMDMRDLRRRLDECLANKRAVYCLVVLIGATEHGSCDPLKEILEVRKEYRKKGLSFVLHADGAWGTYFATTLVSKRGWSAFVPKLPLKAKTTETLEHLRYCDSITADPHKSGYIQYPAGALLYRDERMRYLVTWSSPIVTNTGVQSIGVYGAEGSKPGAAPIAAFFSHVVIGLHPKGYGQIMGQAVFSAALMYAYLVTMSTEETDFIVAPLNMLPSERDNGDVEAEKDKIKRLLLHQTNEQIADSEEAMELTSQIGSDLCINCFAVNFKIYGRANEDVVEANYLGKRIAEKLAIITPNEDNFKKPLFLTSSKLVQAKYKDCLTIFKNRLGLRGEQDLFILLNIVLSPFSTANDLMATIINALRVTIENELPILRYRNELTPDIHLFIMQGTDTIFLVHLAMFNMENYRSQLIITGDIPQDVKAKYIFERAQDPTQLFALANVNKETIASILENKAFDAVIYKGTLHFGNQPLIYGFKLTNIRVIVQRPLNSKYLVPYPRLTMPFFVYGTANQRHIDHVYTASPNIQLSADQVEIKGYNLPDEGPVYAHLNYPERAMQPFPNVTPANFFFSPDALFTSVKFTKDQNGWDKLGEGTIKLTKNIFVDTARLNMDPEEHKVGHHQVACEVPQHPLRSWGPVVAKLETDFLPGEERY